MKFKKAFTLAEVLTVIGIIGVVAALTLPNLNQNTNNKEYVVALKKTAANIQKALDLAKEQYGDYDTWFVGDSTVAAKSTRLGNRLADFLSTTLNCGLDSNKGCFARENMLAISGGSRTSYDKNTSLYKYVLKDGVSVGFYNNSTIYVDVDGPHKGYNTLGIDIFAFPVTSEGNLSYSMNLASFNNTFLSSCKGGTEMNCTAWAMTFDNIGYTKCSDLSYSKTTCK